ncbi:gliding motility-associated protein GldM [Spirosomataceae bacterium TFI 002]|nr:gliding motility-associated protein GldM [Spirosomataceae bacterium TFI 002]
MAGGKETPRQKMISMMYLVLTAMLALQVSNSILEKFLILDTSLRRSNTTTTNTNDDRVKAIQAAVDKSTNKAEYGKYLTQAQEVREKTKALFTYLESLRERIIVEAGGDRDETGKIVNLAEEEKVASIFVGPAKNGEGYKMEKTIDAYIAEIQKYAPEIKLPDVTIQPKDDPEVIDPAEKNKDFVQMMFEATPVPAALAGLSQKKSDILNAESQILGYLASKVGAEDIKFDKIFAVVIPDSRTVVAGQTYKADVAIGAYSSAIVPRISINGAALTVTEGKGSYETVAQGGQYDANGQLKRSYTATISYPKPDGSIQTVNQEETYTVLKPSVQIATASLPALYLRCANKIQTNSPGLGSLFKPTFSGTGADFIPGGGGLVTVVPNSAKVLLTVNNDGVKLEDFPFKVRRVPKPDIQVLANNAPVNDNVKKRGIKASSLRRINVNAIADEDFKSNNPDDANFRVSSYDIFLASGTRPKGSPLKGVSGSQDIGQLAQEAEAGDRYLIIVNKVQRRNFKGEVEEVNIGEFSIEIPLN